MYSYTHVPTTSDPAAPDVGGTNDTALLKLQLAAALRREQLAMQALSHVRQLSDQLSESLAREARLADEITSLHQLIHERGLGVGAQNFEAEKVRKNALMSTISMEKLILGGSLSCDIDLYLDISTTQ